jgi:hypothetical protein
VVHDEGGGASTGMAGAGDGLEGHARNMSSRLRQLRHGGGDSDGRRKKTSVVNHDPRYSIYRGVHRICLLKLVLSYGARRNGSMPTISREDHARLFAKRVSNDLSSEFRS